MAEASRQAIRRQVVENGRRRNQETPQVAEHVDSSRFSASQPIALAQPVKGKDISPTGSVRHLTVRLTESDIILGQVVYSSSKAW